MENVSFSGVLSASSQMYTSGSLLSSSTNLRWWGKEVRVRADEAAPPGVSVSHSWLSVAAVVGLAGAERGHIDAE